MTERERFIRALKRQPIEGRVPTFELVFYLTMEALGKVHPLHRAYSQWDQMSRNERSLQIADMADCYVDIAEKYEHSAIFVHPNPGREDDTRRLLEVIREKTGTKYFLMMHGDSTYGIPDGDGMMRFTERMYDEPEALKAQQTRATDQALERAARLRGSGLLDGYALCSDYCFNTNPFLSPAQFAEFIAPELKRLVSGYHELGFFAIKHTDGNIMPILDQLADSGADALHSVDPQAGVDLKEVKRRVGDRMAVMGNVNCGLLQTGTDEQCVEDTRRALREGMEGWGYVFCTSNCAYTGLSLSRYELMHSIWKCEGIYPRTQP